MFWYRLNDIIVSVNGISTENVTHAQAVETLKRAGRSVLLVRLFTSTATVYSVKWWTSSSSRISSNDDEMR